MDVPAIVSAVEGGNLIAIAAVILAGAIPVAKGVFAVISNRGQRRKEFLELWSKGDRHESNLWLEEVVRHGYGASLSAELIRHIETLERPSLKLKKVAMAGGLLELNATRGQVAWAKRRRDRGRWLLAELLGSMLSYILLVSVGVVCGSAGIQMRSLDDLVVMLFGAVALFFACITFWHLITLVEAGSTLALVNGQPGLLRRCMRKLGKAAGVLGKYLLDCTGRSFRLNHT